MKRRIGVSPKPHENVEIKEGDLFTPDPVVEIKLKAEHSGFAYSAHRVQKAVKVTERTVTGKNFNAETEDPGLRFPKRTIRYAKFSGQAVDQVTDSLQSVVQKQTTLQGKLEDYVKTLGEELSQELQRHEAACAEAFDGTAYIYNEREPGPLLVEATTEAEPTRLLAFLEAIQARECVPASEMLWPTVWSPSSNPLQSPRAQVLAIEHCLIHRRNGRRYGFPGDVFLITPVGEAFLKAVEAYTQDSVLPHPELQERIDRFEELRTEWKGKPAYPRQKDLAFEELVAAA